MKHRHAWLAVVVIVFAAVYAGSLTFAYVDGDDAQSVAYHAMGRSPAIQPPFADYQGGADLLLGLLPPNEPILRTVAMSMTAIGMVGFAALMFALAFDFLRDVSVEGKPVLALVILLSIPELFYLALVYHATAIAMCLIIPSHLMLRRALRQQAADGQLDRSSWFKLIVAAAMLGAGCAIRWSLVVYGWLIFWDWVLDGGRGSTTRSRGYLTRATHAAAWGAMAAVAWWAAVAASGYGITQIYEYQQFARGWMGYNYEWRVVAAQAFSAFGPALLVLSVWGCVVLWRTHRSLAVFALVSALPVLPLLTWADPKQYAWFYPVIFLCSVAGWNACRSRVARWAIVALVLIPWIAGVRITHGDTAWGPGFEMRAFDREAAGPSSLSLALGAGAAVPTPEGPRPLWGHGAVLLGGEWRRFVKQADDERARIIETAVREGLPILVLKGVSGFIVSELARLGFATSDGYDDHPDGELLSARHFTNATGQSVILLKMRPKVPQFKLGDFRIQEVIDTARSDRVIATGYPENLRTLYKAAPDAMRKIGPGSAVLSLRHLMHENGNR